MQRLPHILPEVRVTARVAGASSPLFRSVLDPTSSHHHEFADSTDGILCALSGKESAQGCLPKRLLGRPDYRGVRGARREGVGEERQVGRRGSAAVRAGRGGRGRGGPQRTQGSRVEAPWQPALARPSQAPCAPIPAAPARGCCRQSCLRQCCLVTHTACFFIPPFSQ